MLFNVARKHFLMFDDGMHKKMDNFPGNLDMKDMNQVSKNASELEVSITKPYFPTQLLINNHFITISNCYEVSIKFYSPLISKKWK